jgi:hypothetical protein
VLTYATSIIQPRHSTPTIPYTLMSPDATKELGVEEQVSPHLVWRLFRWQYSIAGVDIRSYLPTHKIASFSRTCTKDLLIVASSRIVSSSFLHIAVDGQSRSLF